MRLSLCISALLTCCTVAAIPTDSVTVSGHISGIPENGRRSLIINECDFSEKSAKVFVELDSTGAFHARIPFSSPHTFSISYNRRFIDAFAEPGDSIHCEIDASSSPVAFHLSGDNATLNEEYSHAQGELIRQYSSVRLPSPDTPFGAYMPEFKANVKRFQNKIDEYVSARDISPEVADMLRIDNIFTLANMAIDYTGTDKNDQSAFFTDSIFDIYNENNARQMIFPYHIGALCLNFPEIVKSTPKGRIRDMMLISLARDTVPRREDFADMIYYDRVFGGPISEIDLTGIKQSDVLVYNDGEVRTIENVDPIDWLVKTYQGKPIYLDVSATWCGPCRSSLSKSESLRDKFKNTDIVFAVLWLKSDKDRWVQLAPTVTNAVHILIDNEVVADAIISRLNLQGFPSSYFIDRSGNILSDHVPSFHSPDLYDFLNSRLK